MIKYEVLVTPIENGSLTSSFVSTYVVIIDPMAAPSGKAIIDLISWCSDT